jgi:hypothetical protein
MNHFHNTISLEGNDLSRAINNAKTQEDRILFIFKVQGVSMSPDQVHRLYQQYFYEVPLTSIRRAISNLSRDKKEFVNFSHYEVVEKAKLEKTEEKTAGRYGKPNYKWRLTQNNK